MAITLIISAIVALVIGTFLGRIGKTMTGGNRNMFNGFGFFGGVVAALLCSLLAVFADVDGAVVVYSVIVGAVSAGAAVWFANR